MYQRCDPVRCLSDPATKGQTALHLVVWFGSLSPKTRPVHRGPISVVLRCCRYATYLRVLASSVRNDLLPSCWSLDRHAATNGEANWRSPACGSTRSGILGCVHARCTSRRWLALLDALGACMFACLVAGRFTLPRLFRAYGVFSGPLQAKLYCLRRVKHRVYVDTGALCSALFQDHGTDTGTAGTSTEPAKSHQKGCGGARTHARPLSSPRSG